jgi:hypothetical protein
MNKKGFVSDALTDGWALITYILIIIIFFVIFSFGKGEIKVEVRADSGNIDYAIVLRDFLRMPFQDATIADLITKMDMQNSGESYNEFVSITKTFLNDQFGADENWILRIKDISTNNALKISRSESDMYVVAGAAGGASIPKGEEFLASQIIPGYNKNYEISLYQEICVGGAC